jgi:hypothetical protein
VDLEALIQNPREAISIELKTWIDPATPEGKAKIAKACMALRNANGGHLLIGFSDQTGAPDPAPHGTDPRADYHQDVIQGIVSAYASERFEVTVSFVERDGQLHPVIAVPTGVRTPVACKSDLPDPNRPKTANQPQGYLLRLDAVYVRSLEANGTVSSTTATWRDHGELTRICMENREADIGAFLSRHLGTGELGALRKVLEDLNPPRLENAPIKVLEQGHLHFEQKVRVKLSPEKKFGTWETAMVIVPPLQGRLPDQGFLDAVTAHNPNLTGWSVWLDTRASPRAEDRPYVLDDAWEAFVVRLDDGLNHLDFMRFEPTGRFYLLRALEDDIQPKARHIEPMTVLDMNLPILRVAEAMAVGQSIARGLGAAEDARLEFAFRWTGLANRQLTSWADPRRGFLNILGGGTARQNDITTRVSLGVSEPHTRIATLTGNAVSPLFTLFEGRNIDQRTISELVMPLLKRPF